MHLMSACQLVPLQHEVHMGEAKRQYYHNAHITVWVLGSIPAGHRGQTLNPE